MTILDGVPMLDNQQAQILQLRQKLTHGSRDERLHALAALDSSSVHLVLEQVVALTNHWRVEIKVAALRALLAVDSALITEVIADSLNDENREVRAVAAELFHRPATRLAA